MHLVIRAEDLFLIYFYLSVFCKGIGLSNNSSIYMLLLLLGISALMIKFIAIRYSKYDITKILVLLVVGVMSFFLTKKPTLMLTCLCLAGMKCVNIEQLFRGAYFIRLFTFISVVSLSLLGVLDNTPIKMWRNGHFDVRYPLGFGHPNSLHLSFFSLVALFMYVYFSKLNFSKYFIIILANIFIYKYSGSRTGLIAVFLLIIAMILARTKVLFIKKIICSAPKYLFVSLLILSFLLAWLYGKVPLVTALDIPLNGRLSFSNHFVTSYGFSIFGHSLVNENALFDNGYLFLYVQYGIVGLFVVGGFIYMICRYVRRTMDVRKAALILVFLVYIFTESFSPNIFMNIVLLFAGPIIFSHPDYVYKRNDTKKVAYNS